MLAADEVTEFVKELLLLRLVFNVGHYKSPLTMFLVRRVVYSCAEHCKYPSTIFCAKKASYFGVVKVYQRSLLSNK